MTVGAAILRATREMAAAGVEIPRRTAEWLWMHAAGASKHDLLLCWRDEADSAVESVFFSFVRRRCAREPLQYILGEAEFSGLKLHVDRRVLIPRPETEELVAVAAAEIAALLRRRSPSGRCIVVDLGTGSGAIAIALARMLGGQGLLPRVRVIATDLSFSALDVARENARRLGVADALEFLQGDALEPVARRVRRIDGLIANPPYISSSKAAELQREVRDYEPAQALYGGPDGLGAYRRIIPAAAGLLAPGGFIALETGAGQAEKVSGMLRESLGVPAVECFPDVQCILRVVLARSPNGSG